MKLLKKKDQKTNHWSGGTTTELAIGPLGSDYNSRKFGWRISTATIEPGASTFTQLPGVHRHLMLLSGEASLLVSDRQVALKEFEVFQFEGSQNVQCQSSGPIVDFNLMTQTGFTGFMEAMDVVGEVTLANIGEVLGLYLVEGDLQEPPMCAGDFMLFDQAVLNIKGQGKVALAYILE